MIRSLVTGNLCKRSLGTLFSRSVHLDPQEVSSQPSNLGKTSENEEMLKHHDFFGVRNSFTIKEMFDARVHLGHKEGTLDERMKPFLVGSRLGSLIIDLNKTKELLGDALNFTAHIVSRGGILLFINRSRQTGFMVEKLAIEVGEYSHCHDFRGGTFSNPLITFGAATRLPDLVIFFNTNNNVLDTHRAVKDAARLAIPTIGIVDTSCDPRLVTYPVPGNDDTPTSIEFYCKVFKNAVLAGKSRVS